VTGSGRVAWKEQVHFWSLDRKDNFYNSV